MERKPTMTAREPRRRWRGLFAFAAAALLFATPAGAQQTRITLLPRSAIGVFLVQEFGGRIEGGSLPTSGLFQEFTGTSSAPGVWAEVTVFEASRVGVHAGFEIADWVDHGVFFRRSIGLGGSYDGRFQHKNSTLLSFVTLRPGEGRVRPVWRLGAAWVRSRYFVWDPGALWPWVREETAAAPGLLAGVELPVNPADRVTFTVRIDGRFVAWLPEVMDDGFGTASLIISAGLQFRLR
jgi:hypothetical protein